MKTCMANAIKTICRDLGLPSGDAYTQDWIYELPEKLRDYESLQRYVAAYSTTSYGETEKSLLMQLMLDVTNDLLQRDKTIEKQAWGSLIGLLRANPKLHREQLEYWALPGEPPEAVFPLTPLVRDLVKELFGSDLSK